MYSANFHEAMIGGEKFQFQTQGIFKNILLKECDFLFTEGKWINICALFKRKMYLFVSELNYISLWSLSK